MGSTQSWTTCPKCKEEGTYGRDYYYRTSEEYCTCLHCGYTHNVSLKKDENGNLIRKMTKRYDLKEGNVFYAETEKDKDGRQVFVKSMSVLPTDTKEDLYFFINLHLCFYPFNEKELPDKFKLFDYDDSSEVASTDVPFNEGVKDNSNTLKIALKNTQHNIFFMDESGIVQLWYMTRDFEIVDGYLEVYEAEWNVEEYGGFGVITTQNGPVITTQILEEGYVPDVAEFTDNVVFATAVIDGELTILKEREEKIE